ncbi:MAG: ATP-binding protein [Acidobacteria bacterium]|nr:ATP-binding protein [Acidobacteriota bacterium]
MHMPRQDDTTRGSFKLAAKPFVAAATCIDGYRSAQFANRLFALVLVAMLSPGDAHCLDPRKPVTQYVHDVWQTEDGLPMSSVGPVVQTPDGYIWVGTQEGLVRFDGARFQIFHKGNTDAIRNNHIAALLAARDGSVWAGTAGGGVTRMHRSRFSHYSTDDGLSGNIVVSICEDRAGGVWFGAAGGGLSYFKDGHFLQTPFTDQLSHAVVTSICEDREGRVWAGTADGGLFVLGDGRCEAYHAKLGLPPGGIWSICQDREGSLWFGVKGAGLCRYRDGSLTTYTTNQGMSSNVVHCLYEDRGGALWIGTDGGGLIRAYNGKFAVYGSKEGLGSDYVLSIVEDREGSLWIGTGGGGLNRLKDGAFMTYGSPEGLSRDIASTVLEDRDGSMWIGTFGGGLNHLKDGGVTVYGEREGLPGVGPYSLCQDRQGALWIGTNGGGLVRMLAGKCTTFTARDGLSNPIVRCVMEDGRGTLWIGTNGGGLNAFRKGEFTAYQAKDGLAGGIVICLLEGREGALWIGTAGGGLNLFRDGLFSNYHVPGDAVMCLYEDGDGVLWIGATGGLCRMKDGVLTSFTTKDGLFNDMVAQILEDDEQNLWMGSNTGVFRVSKRELDDLAAGRRSKVTSVAYGKRDGLRDTECNAGFHPSGCRTRDGRLWFATVRGAAVVDPTKIQKNQLPPPVAIGSVRVDGRSIEVAEETSLPPGQRNLEIHYSGLSFLDPDKVEFKYRLEGFDAEWIEAGTRRAAYYTNVPPGHYVFRVIACNNDGLWNNDGASVALTLAPRLYETFWFYAVLASLPLLAGYGLHRFRVRLITARASVLDERNRLAREIHDTVAQDLSGIVIHLEAARDLPSGSGESIRSHIERACSSTRACLDEVRRSIWALRPGLLEGADLGAALEMLAKQVSAGTRISVRSEIRGPSRPLSEEAEIHLLRVAQEAISNAVRHAGPTEILVELSYKPREITVRVRDNGCGFDPNVAEDRSPPRFGLMGMRQRIARLGGRLVVNSQPGAGTEVVIVVPLRGFRYRLVPLMARLRRAVKAS